MKKSAEALQKRIQNGESIYGEFTCFLANVKAPSRKLIHWKV